MYIPILHAWPWPITPAGKLWLFLPLVMCVAVVYRATRSRTVRHLPWDTLVTFINIVVGMCVIAIAFYVTYEVVIYFF